MVRFTDHHAALIMGMAGQLPNIWGQKWGTERLVRCPQRRPLARQLFRWKKLTSGGGKAAVQADDLAVGAEEVRALKKCIRDLERMLGKETIGVEIL